MSRVILPNPKALAAARRRRDAGKRPLAIDAALLAAVGDAPNLLSPRASKEPTAGTAVALVLAAFRAFSEPADWVALAAAKGLKGRPKVAGAIDYLRKCSFDIQTVHGGWVLVEHSSRKHACLGNSRRPY